MGTHQPGTIPGGFDDCDAAVASGQHTCDSLYSDGFDCDGCPLCPEEDEVVAAQHVSTVPLPVPNPPGTCKRKYAGRRNGKGAHQPGTIPGGFDDCDAAVASGQHTCDSLYSDGFDCDGCPLCPEEDAEVAAKHVSIVPLPVPNPLGTCKRKYAGRRNGKGAHQPGTISGGFDDCDAAVASGQHTCDSLYSDGFDCDGCPLCPEEDEEVAA